LIGLLYGFTGVQLGPGDPETWSRHAVRLPAGWRSLRVERIWVRGEAQTLEARSGAEGARIGP
jgi:protein-glucosylgalactosylhydroxylysine glucosidase